MAYLLGATSLEAASTLQLTEKTCPTFRNTVFERKTALGTPSALENEYSAYNGIVVPAGVAAIL